MEIKNNTLAIIIIVAIAVFLLSGIFSFSFANKFAQYGMMGMMGGGYGYSMMFFGWITWVLVVVLIIAGIYWLIKTADKK
ncbi:hypothetical protein J4402_05150 [Candidatus Pacearchaeota archaeon]|nr:hypothetical protein [Candidatus Pacearchaeota archaeon]